MPYVKQKMVPVLLGNISEELIDLTLRIVRCFGYIMMRCHLNDHLTHYISVLTYVLRIFYFLYFLFLEEAYFLKKLLEQN